MALQICASVRPANEVPLTMKVKLAPGAIPSFGLPPLKLPVVHPKSSTVLLN